MNCEDKVKLSNKIYPIFFGFSGDLLFWVAINTIFLTVVKGFSAAEISSLTAIGNFISILIYPLAFRVIKKIGNISSIKLGTILLLCSALLLTFSKKYFLILIGYILYDTAFLFKNMDNVILRKNLKYENRLDDYIKIQSKSSLIYSFLTMIVAFVSGFLFNINNYLPMILCILCCVLSIILSSFLYEYKSNEGNRFEIRKKPQLKITKIITFILVLYALVYATIDIGQANTKLFIQYKLSSFLNMDKVAIYLSFIVAISRILRVVSNFLFTRICSNKSDNLLFKIGFSLMISFMFIIVGSLLNLNIVKIFLMSIGFFIFLIVRDPFSNYTKTLLLNNCDENAHELAITYLTISRKVGKFLISTIITLLLLKIDMLYVMILLLLISIFDIFIIGKIYKLLDEK